MEVDLKILLSAILFLLCHLQAECADRKGGVTANQLHHLSALYSVGDVGKASGGVGAASVSTSKTSASSSADFRLIMKSKSNLIHHSATTPSTPTATEKTSDESFPDQLFATGVDLGSDDDAGNVTLSGKLQQSKNDTKSEGVDLGVETTINPFQDEEAEEFAEKPQAEDQQARQVETEVEDDRADVVNINQLDGKHVSSAAAARPSHTSRVKAAVITKHSFEFRPIRIEPADHEAIHEPKIIEVEAKSMPLEIHFKSASSRIKLVQSHKALDELNEIQRTSSNEEPQRLFHTVHKPIISEVREIIIPHRRIIQEIRPVQEQVHTVVTHESDESRERLSKLKQERTQKQQQQQQQPKPQGNNKAAAAAVGSNKKQTRPAPIDEQPRQQQQQQQRTDSRKQPTGTTSASVTPTYATTPKSSVPVQQTEVTQSYYDDVAEDRENDDESELDDSVGLIDGKDFSAIIPARLMDQIISKYGVRTKPGKTSSRLQQTSDFNGTVARPVKYDDDQQQVVQQQRLESSKKSRTQQPRPQAQKQQQQPAAPLSPVAKLVEQQNRARQYGGGAVKSVPATNVVATAANNNARETIAPRNFRRPEPLQQQPQQQQQVNTYGGGQAGHNNNNQQSNRLVQRPQATPYQQQQQQQQQSSYQQQQQQIQQLRESESRHYARWQSRYNPRVYEPYYAPVRNNNNNLHHRGVVVPRHHQAGRYY